MKIFKWAQQHKYQIGFFLVAALCIYFFIQGLKKDHSLDLVKQKMEMKEQERESIIKVREFYQPIIEQYNRNILSIQIRDSLINTRAMENLNQIKTISTPKYVKQKTEAIDALSDPDLRGYFINLPTVPEPNDY